MISRTVLKTVFTAAAVLATFDMASAQSMSGGYPSRAGGAAARELNLIREDSIGRGYTAESLNQIALRSAQAQVPNVGQRSTPSGPRIGLGVGGSSASKPFSSFSPAPTVSPYLNLFREDFDGNSDFNYNTLVRPALQQERFNEQMQRQSLEINRRLQSIAAQTAYNPQGSTSQYPTGHQTVFMYYGHFYPTAGRQRR